MGATVATAMAADQVCSSKPIRRPPGLGQKDQSVCTALYKLNPRPGKTEPFPLAAASSYPVKCQDTAGT